MPLFHPFDVDQEMVASFVKTHWPGAQILTCLKASQNQTYKAQYNDQPCVVRVSPFNDFKGNQVDVETTLLTYLKKNGMSVCAPIPSASCDFFLILKRDEGVDLIVTMFSFAIGEEVNFSSYNWLTNYEIVDQIGQWFGTFHNLSEQFRTEVLANLSPRFGPPLPESADIFSIISTFRQNLDGTLADATLHPNDIESQDDPHQYGLLQGDVNVSNFFIHPLTYHPCVFDWDQMQTGHFLFDLTQTIINAVLRIDGNYGGIPHPEGLHPRCAANFASRLVDGYIKTRKFNGASEPQKDKSLVCYDTLKRMMLLRKTQYSIVCLRTVIELGPNNPPQSQPMKDYCQFIVDWLNRGDFDIDTYFGDDWVN